MEANTTIEPINTSDPYLGSEHRPKWLSLKQDWESRKEKVKAERIEKVTDLGTEGEEKEINIVILNTMFRDTCSRLTPKSISYREDAKEDTMIIKPKMQEEKQEGLDIKPEIFPETLWNLVEPKQRRRVAGRFEKFKDKEYLEQCVQKIITDLDILNRKEESVEWLEGEEVAQDEKVLRAQALANIDAYFIPDPKVAELARDVVAEINTTDERPMRCRPRKLSAVQQAFLQAKTNIMVEQGKLEESQGQWSHGLVLVA